MPRTSQACRRSPALGTGIALQIIQPGPSVAESQILTVDIGGSHVKLWKFNQRKPVKIPSGPQFTPQDLAHELPKWLSGWNYSVASVGFPSPVKEGQPVKDPKNLGPGWKKLDFGKLLGCPTRVVNDALLQALGCYRGGRMLFLGLGTGLGSALILDRILLPLELSELPYKKKGKTLEDYLGNAGRLRLGIKRWSKHLWEVIARLQAAFLVDYVVLGGGNAKRLVSTPPGVIRETNRAALQGGIRLWKESWVLA
ncbi:ROK family protein [Candidatus Methylacidithermus pantelleriae]|uniref:Polyphosphate glucokinase n=1 Tax=Candidatus Methylacidithermus pantelleriae TaxID=2744239 RepID=A0A8J2BKS3_9BACT|nr:ROK family protein [Candidatus Methylacidithermus pantelleriae]CAF0700853.1 Polyphosphate glucokinase [Candidatus Methylacidithermus pantelleriae]